MSQSIPQFLYWHASQTMRIGKYPEAAELYFAAFDKYGHVDSLIGYAFCLIQQNAFEKAKMALERAPTLNALQVNAVNILKQRIALEEEKHGKHHE